MKKNQKIKTNPIPPGVLSGLSAPGRMPAASDFWWLSCAFKGCFFRCFFYRYKLGEMESNFLVFRNLQGRLQVAAQARWAECRPEAIRHS
ncbi:MAG: hypothetical protein V5804_09265 [Mucilaginibacter sp.]|uniref:hypothetical protein n=1 Tax=Mucilaginibacter sp. TaxID=1882438 RepID=UPI0034E3B896